VVSVTNRSLIDQAIADFQKRTEDLANSQEQLRIDREKLEEERSKTRKFVNNSDVVELNVGGELMLTTRSTLTRVTTSILATMFNGRREHKLIHDRDGNIFLDFNPILFRHLLEQLRVLEDNDPFVFHAPSSAALVVPFEKMLKKLGFDPAPKSDDDVIILNVGDEIVRTRRKTLLRVPNSKLATIISSSKQINTDNNGYLFLDYDPKLFRHLLDQLRKTQATNVFYFDAPSQKEKDAFDAMLIDLGLSGEY
jgi:hypothetical protein